MPDTGQNVHCWSFSFNPFNPVDQYRYDKLSIVNITVNEFSGEGVKPVYRGGQPEYLPGLHVLVWSRRSRRTCLV